MPRIGNPRLVLPPDLDAVFEARGTLEGQQHFRVGPPQAQRAAGCRQRSPLVVEKVVGLEVNRGAGPASRLSQLFACPAEIRGRDLDLDLLLPRRGRRLLAVHGKSRRAISCARFPSTRPR